MSNSERLIQYDQENIRPYFEHDMFFARQRYPGSYEESYAVLDELEELADGGKHIALVDGSFDVPQPNHQWYLHHCRILAARDFYASQGITNKSIVDLAACEDVFLVVTLDTDERVAGIKGARQEKGGIQKPVYPWQLRAQYISNFMTPTGNGTYMPIVDMVTIDGSETEFGTPHESHLAFGAALLAKNALHTWLFYGEHDSKRGSADKLIELSGALNAKTVGIVEHIDYCVDDNGKPWKSTAIIKKIRGEA